MDGDLKLAELKGYVTAKVDEYSKIVTRTNNHWVSVVKVADDFSDLLEMIIDMLGQKDLEEQTETADFNIDFTRFTETLKNLNSRLQGRSEEM
ncbi:hypothetical protein [Clostridium thermarum]|uniref:hypothetical protein n=1 Tax=Clostridium thermarum TaxID=1716543 RepID=UPI0011232E32|nr:hypothetical protein [Clostridium thermarum]